MAKEFVTNQGYISLKSGTVSEAIGLSQYTLKDNGSNVTLKNELKGIFWTFVPGEDTIDGETYATSALLYQKLLSFSKGGGSGTGAVDSVQGDIVDNEDPKNPIVNLPDWVLALRADRVGGLNISEGGAYTIGSSYIDATMLLAGSGTNFNNYTLRFPKLTGVKYKRHMIIFNVNIENINLEPLENAKIKAVPTQAKVDDIWTLTYDSFSNSWNLEAINSMPRWYIDQKLSKTQTGWQTVEGDIEFKSGRITVTDDSNNQTTTRTGTYSTNGFTLADEASEFFAVTRMEDLTSDRTITIPNKSGTIALLNSDGTMDIADATQNNQAVNLGQLLSLLGGVNIVSDTEITFDQTGYYTYTGETNIESTLPPLADSVGRRYIILNTTGAGSLKIIGNIFEAGEVKTELTIMAGENYIIYNNGIHWVIV